MTTFRRSTIAVAMLVLTASCKGEKTPARVTPVTAEALGLAEWRARFPVLRSRDDTGTHQSAQVSVPSVGSAEVELRDARSALGVRFALRGARSMPLATDGALGIYPGALSGADMIHRIDRDGIEDFIAFPARPSDERVVYDLDVSQAAGLRLVGDVLELVDAMGVPRLRAAAPYVVDARGRTSNARFSIEDCAFDANPSAPWTRPPTPPGKRRCAVSVSWEAQSYPALVDPHWTTTGAMTRPRERHFNVLLATGDVLVAGGQGTDTQPSTGSAKEADLYHPSTGTFAATGPLMNVRLNAAAVRLASGNVLVIGGTPNAAVTELYDPALGTFTASGQLSSAREGVAATVLASGKVLVAGGGAGATVSTVAEVFDPGTATFAPTGSMAVARTRPTAARLPSGKVLFLGGAPMGQQISAVEVFDPASGTFSTSAATYDRPNPIAALLPSGKLLVASGNDAKLFDPQTSTFTTTGAPIDSRFDYVAVSLPSGNVILAGGSPVSPVIIASVDLYDASAGAFAALPPMSSVRTAFAATALPSGDVLVTGGMVTFFGPNDTRSAEVLHIIQTGKSCAGATGDCESGNCVDGVCCNTACLGQCEACDVPGSVGTCTAVTGKPHGTRTACTAPGAGKAAICAPSCDGVKRAACAYPKGAVRCDKECTAAVDTESTCDGAGHCIRRPSRPCEGHFACADAQACKTKCATNDDCAKGYTCDASGACSSNVTCVDERTSQSTTGELESCLPYRCATKTGTCGTTCMSVDDCVSPNACDPSGHCVPLGGDDGGGCSLSLSSRRTPTVAAALLAMGLAALVTRRKRSQRRG